MINYKGFKIVKQGGRTAIHRLGEFVMYAVDIVTAKMFIDNGEVYK